MKQIKKTIYCILHCEFSKLLTFTSGVIFIISLFIGYKLSKANINDLAFCVTAITVTGGCFGMAIRHYLNEQRYCNVAKIEASSYNKLLSARLKYNEQMMILKTKYGYSDEEIQEIEADSFIDEASDRVVDRFISSTDESLTDSSMTDEVTTF